MSIHTSSVGGSIVYQERDSVVTNALGLFHVPVGQGAVLSGTFSAIDWGGGSKYLQVELDTSGGTNYTDLGASQLLSVPYALYAGKSGLANIPATRIPYGSSAGLVSDANFTRDTAGGNTLMKTVKGSSYYAISMGDSTYLDVGLGSLLNVPSVTMSYGDTTGDFAMNIGVGKVPGYGITQMGFLNLSRSDGAFSGINFLEYDSNPMLIVGTNYGGITADGGSNLSLKIDETQLYYSVGENKKHGISADSVNLRFYSSPTDYSWTWPNSDGSDGDVLTTNGSGAMTWEPQSGYALQFASANFNPSDSSTYYIGQRVFLTPSQNTQGNRAITIPHSGTLIAAYFYAYDDGTFGSNENVSVYIRKGSATDYTLSTTVKFNAYRTDVANTSLSIPVSAGDQIEIKIVTPTWATNPTNVGFSGILYIK